METHFLVGGHPATAQQANCISLCLGSEDIKIEAGAGTGKTSLLASLAHAKKGKGLYITFNADIAKQATAMFPPRKVKCKTAHSLAYQAVGKKYRSRLKRRLTGGMVAKAFSAQETGGVSAFAIGSLAIQTLQRFCYSADIELLERHVPFSELKKIDNDVYRALVRDEVLDIAKLLFQDMAKLRGKLPITHDFYLKKWALSKPDLGVDYILMDESQDTNDVLIDLLESQDSQIIWVGDSDQSIYSWRGAVNAMDKVQTSKTAQITQSFRFGSAVADAANAVLEKHLESELRLTGFEAVESVLEAVERPDAIICRTNAEAMRHMIAATNSGVKATFMGGVAVLSKQISALKTLHKTGRTNHVDFAMFQSYGSFAGYAYSKDGAEFRPLVQMIDEYDFDPLLGMLASIKDVDEGEAELIITTAHKAKGLEWDKVRLGSDFKAPGMKGYRKEESNLLYVAITRAKTHLDLTQCKAALLAIGVDASHLEDESKAPIVITPPKPKSVAAKKRVTSAAPAPKVKEIDPALKDAIEEFKKLSSCLEERGVNIGLLLHDAA